MHSLPVEHVAVLAIADRMESALAGQTLDESAAIPHRFDAPPS